MKLVNKDTPYLLMASSGKLPGCNAILFRFDEPAKEMRKRFDEFESIACTTPSDRIVANRADSRLLLFTILEIPSNDMPELNEWIEKKEEPCALIDATIEEIDELVYKYGVFPSEWFAPVTEDATIHVFPG